MSKMGQWVFEQQEKEDADQYRGIKPPELIKPDPKESDQQEPDDDSDTAF